MTAEWTEASLREDLFEHLQVRGILARRSPDVLFFQVQSDVPLFMSRRTVKVRIDFQQLLRDVPRLLADARTYSHLDGLGDQAAVLELLGDYALEMLGFILPGTQYLEWRDCFFRRVGGALPALPADRGPFEWH